MAKGWQRDGKAKGWQRDGKCQRDGKGTATGPPHGTASRDAPLAPIQSLPRPLAPSPPPQCTRLAGYDEEDIVSEAIEEVKSQLGAKGLGPKGKIDYMESAGEEAKEGRLLVEALLSNVGALWDESRSLRYMMDHWRDVCNEVDTDKSGTISEEEAAEIWDKVLTAFRQTVLKKLQQLGVVEKAIAKISTVATPPAQRL